MPIYHYQCEANGETVEVVHSIKDDLATWGDVCRALGREPGGTDPAAPVQRLLFPPAISTPAGDSHLKNLGFTKLVKRDTGVYENVTATGGEKRYMTAGDASSVPHIHKKVSD